MNPSSNYYSFAYPTKTKRIIELTKSKIVGALPKLIFVFFKHFIEWFLCSDFVKSVKIYGLLKMGGHWTVNIAGKLNSFIKLVWGEVLLTCHMWMCDLLISEISDISCVEEISLFKRNLYTGWRIGIALTFIGYDLSEMLVNWELWKEMFVDKSMDKSSKMVMRLAK